jgi:predicted lipoprotein with Yx(FWY)xxD motif
MNRFHLGAAGALVVVLAIAGCGGGSSSKQSAKTTSTKPAAAKRAAATVSLRSTKLGPILVDAQGRTLYLFEADKTTKSTCDGACASAWPPLTVTGMPTAGTGIKASLLGTSKRGDGTTEVTYAGHPLYGYAGDTAAGDTTGQGLDQFGAEWYVLSAAGHKVEKGDKTES